MAILPEHNDGKTDKGKILNPIVRTLDTKGFDEAGTVADELAGGFVVEIDLPEEPKTEDEVILRVDRGHPLPLPRLPT